MKKATLAPQRTAEGETCSYCKLVGHGSPATAKLVSCGRCLRARSVRVLYCSRKCQAGAWPAHRPVCAQTAWSLAQHPHHRPATRRYVARLTSDVMIYTVFWKREPNYEKRLYVNRILPYLLSYELRVPRRWLSELRHFDAPYRSYVSRLATEVVPRTLLWRRASNVARRVWAERIVPYLLDDGDRVPRGW